MFTTIIHEWRKSLGITVLEYCVADKYDRLSRNREHPFCTMPQEYIAEDLSVSREFINRTLKKLEAIGLVERGEGRNGGWRTTPAWFMAQETWLKNLSDQKSLQGKKSVTKDHSQVTKDHSVSDQKSLHEVTKDHTTNKNNQLETNKRTNESVVFPLSGEPRTKVLEILGSESELIRFEDYWTEPNAKGKQLWQFKPTFDVFRRARTWAERAAKDRAKNAPRGVATTNVMDRPRYVSGLPGAFTFPQIREMLESGKIRTESDYEGKITYVLNSHAPQA